MVDVIARYLLPGALLLACLAVATAGYLAWRNAALRAENETLTIRVNGCSARLSNIIKDRVSDEEIDRIPDDGLRSVPPSWLLPSP
ncbi:hypothetical protein ACRARG_04460 [Pseudooceanicola sp. C21-150M6]|uniref:hypothetical protein n=1 Tax=Pseudooceanicola sp. C21-150M6 TaxID=3434355 RepID=UPI003D7FE3CA